MQSTHAINGTSQISTELVPVFTLYAKYTLEVGNIAGTLSSVIYVVRKTFSCHAFISHLV